MDYRRDKGELTDAIQLLLRSSWESRDSEARSKELELVD